MTHKQNFLRWCPWIVWLLEATILLGGGFKLIALQTNHSQQLEDAWVATKEIYQLALSTDTLEKKPIGKSIHEKIAAQLGTKITYCKAPSRFGYQGTTFSIEGLDAVPGIQTSYGPITIPCENEWIEVRPGKIGKLKRTQESIDTFEIWFWILGLILVIFKFAEIYLTQVKSQNSVKRKKKIRRIHN